MVANRKTELIYIFLKQIQLLYLFPICIKSPIQIKNKLRKRKNYLEGYYKIRTAIKEYGSIFQSVPKQEKEVIKRSCMLQAKINKWEEHSDNMQSILDKNHISLTYLNHSFLGFQLITLVQEH